MKVIQTQKSSIIAPDHKMHPAFFVKIVQQTIDLDPPA